jgi:hypothetical protein
MNWNRRYNIAMSALQLKLETVMEKINGTANLQGQERPDVINDRGGAGAPEGFPEVSEQGSADGLEGASPSGSGY